MTSNRGSVLLGYSIWPKDSSTRLFPWTRDFIACHGWRVYFWDILWHSIIQYRLLNWRCWVGHRLGETTWWYEDGFRYEGMRECERPNCEFYVEVED